MALEIQLLDMLFPHAQFHSQAHEPQLNGKMVRSLKKKNNNKQPNVTSGCFAWCISSIQEQQMREANKELSG